MTEEQVGGGGSNRSTLVGKWEEVATGSLRPAARRTRSHPGHKRKLLEASILQHGILDPLTISAAGVIVDGHLRWEVAKELKLRTVPVISIGYLNEAELRAHAIAANKLPSVANYQIDELRLELNEIKAELPEIDLTLTGFTVGEIDRIDGRYAAGRYDDLDETNVPEETEPPVAQRGDLYALGEHRLICGDSLDPDVFARLMGSDVAHCCFTDPPYNVKINGHVSGSGQHQEFAMASGEMSSGEFENFLLKALGHIDYSMADGALAFVCMDHAHIKELTMAGAAVFGQQLNIIVWDKGHGGMGSLWRSQHEFIAVFKKGDEPHINNVQLGKNGRNRTNVWSYPGMAGGGKRRKKALELHPTVKPVALIAEALLDVTAPGHIVLDPFGGSGSTLIAAERIERRARLIEYEPIYVDRTIARWERMTGQKAELISRAAPLAEPMLEEEDS